MNDQIYVLSTRKKTTNHVLHLLMCIPTFGIWLIVWGFTHSDDKRHNKRLDKQIDQLLRLKLEGRTDLETYHAVAEDNKKEAEWKRYVWKGRLTIIGWVVGIAVVVLVMSRFR